MYWAIFFVVLFVVAEIATNFFEKKFGRWQAALCASVFIFVMIVAGVYVGLELDKGADNRAVNDSTTLEHFLSGAEITLPEINGVIGVALHPQIKQWVAKHFPPDKQEEAYRAMLEEIFSKKIKLEMPASIAPYFTPPLQPAQ